MKWDLIALATEAALAPVMGVGLGIYVERQLSCGPWGTIAGAILGLWVMLILLRRLNKRLSQDE